MDSISITLFSYQISIIIDHCTDQLLQTVIQFICRIVCLAVCDLAYKSDLTGLILFIQNNKTIVLTVCHVFLICKQSKFILVWCTCVWAEALTVAALITHIST